MWNVSGFFKSAQIIRLLSMLMTGAALVLSSGCEAMKAKFNAKTKTAPSITTTSAATDGCREDALPFGGGNGSAGSPYLLCSEAHLFNVDSSSDYTAANFKVSKNITITATDTPPLFYQTKFVGTFDGGGYTISGFNYSNAEDISGTLYVGLIAHIGTGGALRDLVVANASLNGPSVVGGAVGYNQGTVERVSVINSNIRGTSTIGGVAGMNSGTMSDVFFSGIVSGQQQIGGIAGNNQVSMGGESLYKAYSTGLVVGSSYIGGIVGQNTSVIGQSASTSTVMLSQTQAGGANVTNAAGITSYSSGTIEDVFFAGDVIADGIGSYVAGLVSQNQGNHYQMYSAASMVKSTISNDAANMAPVTSDDWNVAATIDSYFYSLPQMPIQVDGWDMMFWTKTLPETGITAYTAAQMASAANFPNFNFATKWEMPASGTYTFPILQFMDDTDPFRVADGGIEPQLTEHTLPYFTEDPSLSGYTFDDTPSGSAAFTSIYFNNQVDAVITVDEVTMSTGDHFEDLGTGTCAPALNVGLGSNCSINLKFNSPAQGTFFDVVQVKYTVAGKQFIAGHLIEANGTESAARLYSNSWGSPANTIVEHTSAAFTLAFTKRGPNNVNVISASFDNSEYIIDTDNCTGTNLAADFSQCTINVKFAPIATGIRFAKLTVTYQDTVLAQTYTESIRTSGLALGHPFNFGKGIAGDPYLIYNDTDFNLIGSYPDSYYKQMVNLDDAATPLTSATFTGNYNGNSMTIDNLDDAMFGYCGAGSSIYDINLTNVNIVSAGGNKGTICHQAAGAAVANVNVQGSINVAGSVAVGGIVGWGDSGATISDSYANINVVGSERCGTVAGYWGGTASTSITNTRGSGSVTCTNYVGGFVGALANIGSIDSSSTDATVSSNGWWTGGFTGVNWFTLITNSYATGTVMSTGNGVGGFVGINAGDATNNGIVDNCFSTGNVTGGTTVGGFIGQNNDADSSVSNSFSTGNVTATSDYAGGFAGNIVAGVFTATFAAPAAIASGGANIKDYTAAGGPSVGSSGNYFMGANVYGETQATAVTAAVLNNTGLAGFDFISPIWKTTTVNPHSPSGQAPIQSWACTLPGVTCN